MRKRMHQIELFVKFPHNVQNELLFKLLSTAKNTEWGEKHDFKNIKTYLEFKNKIPISNYNNLEHESKRVRQGEENILWPTPTK